MTIKYYPVSLDVNHRECLVVGGGRVGFRKAEALALCNARVTVISPLFDQALWGSCSKTIQLVIKEYQKEDLNGMFLVIGATDKRELNRLIGREARQKNILFNGADLPEMSDFIVPAVVSRGDLTIAVSTSGNSPAFARKIKQDLERQFGPEYEDFLFLMGRIRKRLLTRSHDPDEHRKLFRQLLDRGLFDLVKEKDQGGINLLLLELLGKEYEFQEIFPGENK